jgi:hypothetical protein
MSNFTERNHVSSNIAFFILLLFQFYLLFWPYSPLLGLGLFFSFLIQYTVASTPWTGDQPIARPLLTQQEKRRINACNIDTNILSGIRTHGPSLRASEDSSGLRPYGHCDRLSSIIRYINIYIAVFPVLFKILRLNSLGDVCFYEFPFEISMSFMLIYSHDYHNKQKLLSFSTVSFKKHPE